jgi:hypothetical protein
MNIINGYKYNSETEAQAAQNSCNNYYGIPESSEDVTKNWVDYLCAELNKPLFWYIIYDESLQVVLGKPISFEVVTPPFPPIK